MREPRKQRQVIANHCGRQAWSNHGKHRPCTDMSRGQTPTPPDSATSRPAPRGVCNCFHMESRPRKSKAELSFIGAATAGGRAGTPAATCGAITPPAPIFTHREIFKAGQGTAGTNRGTFADCFSGRVWPKKHFALAFFGVYLLAVFSPPGRCKSFFCSRDRAGH